MERPQGSEGKRRVWVEAVPAVGGGPGLARIRRRGAGEPVGHVRWRAGWPSEELATVEAIELVAGERGRGYGAEAVRELEGLLAEEGVRGLAAAVEPDDGLGLFFWLRLGFRPMGAREGPADGRFWMVRMHPAG